MTAFSLVDKPQCIRPSVSITSVYRKELAQAMNIKGFGINGKAQARFVQGVE